MAHLGFNRLFTGSRRDLVASNIEPSSGRNKINLKNKSKGLTRLLGFFWNGNLNKNISFSGNIKSWKKAVHNLEIQGYGICYDNCLKKEHVCQIQVLGWKPQYITRRRPIPYTFFGTILLFYWHSSFGVHI